MITLIIYLFTIYKFKDVDYVIFLWLVFFLEFVITYLITAGVIDYTKKLTCLTTIQKILCFFISIYATFSWFKLWLLLIKVSLMFCKKASTFLTTQANIYTTVQLQTLYTTFAINRLLILLLLTLILLWLCIRTTALYFIIPAEFEIHFAVLGFILFTCFFIIAAFIFYKCYCLYTPITLIQCMKHFITFQDFLLNVIYGASEGVLFDKNTLRLVAVGVMFILLHVYLFYLFLNK